jgi:hypothetical protein
MRRSSSISRRTKSRSKRTRLPAVLPRADVGVRLTSSGGPADAGLLSSLRLPSPQPAGLGAKLASASSNARANAAAPGEASPPVEEEHRASDRCRAIRSFATRLAPSAWVSAAARRGVMVVSAAELEVARAREGGRALAGARPSPRCVPVPHCGHAGCPRSPEEHHSCRARSLSPRKLHLLPAVQAPCQAGSAARVQDRALLLPHPLLLPSDSEAEGPDVRAPPTRQVACS